MITFRLNDKEISSDKKLNFGALIELEDLGLQLKEIETKSFKLIAILIAFYSGLTFEETIKEIDEHLEKGGKFSDFNSLINEFAQSDFFQKLQA